MDAPPHATPALALLAAALIAWASPAAADDRTICLAACEETTQTCLDAVYDTYDACSPAANESCERATPTEQTKCLSTALQACTRTRTSETQSCRATLKSCAATCGPRDAGQYEFWCELDADIATDDVHVRMNAFCVGPPGASPGEQHDYCMKLFTPTDPAMGYSLDCNPLL
ncbi:hypothetical protein [Hyphomicrobium sp.]|uniref:hypothetical protein n=1 Tax=Hyphomicrobium sp. TaxID=82 RepID=UPI002C203A16|nr:hypothetical protein [Hyphomicrobium sp.]HRN89554.1 hypothetical protein [Hyphomicrobium sp.]HRQ27939.1 hypothetical protein [Hyphomicrobium sp.]